MNEEKFNRIYDAILSICMAILIVTMILFITQAYAETPPVKGATIAVPFKAMCTPRYSAHVRPPVYYTNKIKKSLMSGHTGRISDYELDHLIPISIGGDPRSLDNLWLQSWPDAKKKDIREAELHRLVCSGRIPVQKAQAEMASWR